MILAVMIEGKFHGGKTSGLAIIPIISPSPNREKPAPKGMLSKHVAYASGQRCFSGTIAHAPVSNYQMMLMSNTGLDFRAVRLPLSALNKSFVLFFCGASLYTFSISLHALVVLYSAKRQSSKEITSDAGPPIGILLHGFANLRQLHLFTVYLFRFCIAM